MINSSVFRKKSLNGLIDEIDQLIKLDFSSLQSWRATKNDWPVGESKAVNGSKNTKIYQDDKNMRFITVIPPLAEFPTHWHDCTEICQVLSGVLGDKTNGKKWGKDEKAVFHMGEAHTPYNPSTKEDLHLIVEFFKK